MKDVRRICCVLALGTCLGVAPAAGQEPVGESDLAARVQALFAARCAECHGPALRQPLGRFGYVLDLKRVAENPRLVKPFDPEASKLWILIRNDEMPEDGEPLTAKEKEVVRTWIATGAPAGATQAAPPVATPAAPPAGRSLLQRFFGWVGRFHILVIHFPIALLFAAALGEFWCFWRKTDSLEPAVRFCVQLGAGGAVLAVALGWLHAVVGGFGASSPGTLALHGWLGTAASVWAAAVAGLTVWDAGRRRRWLFRVALWAGAVLIAATAHLGGTLVHGDGFFDF
jgi:uncharacterized membrane protein